MFNEKKLRNINRFIVIPSLCSGFLVLIMVKVPTIPEHLAPFVYFLLGFIVHSFGTLMGAFYGLNLDIEQEKNDQ